LTGAGETRVRKEIARHLGGNDLRTRNELLAELDKNDSESEANKVWSDAIKNYNSLDEEMIASMAT